MRRESEDYYGDNYLAAQRKVQQLVDEYNNVRLHAALGSTSGRENSNSETQVSDERTAPTSYNPHDINEESTTAAKGPLNRAQPL